MSEFANWLFMLLGLFSARYVDPGASCADAACVSEPERTVVAWSVPRTVRADEVRLFSRSERRPGMPGPVLILQTRSDHEPVLVPPAAVRLRAFLDARRGAASAERVEVRVLRGASAR